MSERWCRVLETVRTRGSGLSFQSVSVRLLVCYVLWTGCDVRRVHDPSEGGEQRAWPVLQVTGGFADGAGGRRPEASVKRIAVTRKGVRKDAVVLVAPAEVFTTIPAGAGSVVLECSAATVFNIGDGIQLSVEIERADRREPVYGRLFEPGRRSQDREWNVIRIPLNLPGQAETKLRWSASAGPRGDLTADWLALSNIHLLPLDGSASAADSQ